MQGSAASWIASWQACASAAWTTTAACRWVRLGWAGLGEVRLGFSACQRPTAGWHASAMPVGAHVGAASAASRITNEAVKWCAALASLLAGALSSLLTAAVPMLAQEAACGALATFLEEGEPERHMAPYMAAILQTLAAALQVGGFFQFVRFFSLFVSHMGLGCGLCMEWASSCCCTARHGMARHGAAWFGTA